MIHGLKNWVARLFARVSVPSPRTSLRRSRFRLEPLEVRITPSFGFAVAAADTDNSDYSQANAVATDSAGNSYVTGWFAGNADFGGTLLSAQGNQDAFVAMYNSSGALEWVDDLGSGGATVIGNAIAVQGGNVYLTGYFNGTINFPNSANTLNSSGGNNAFVVELDSQGNYLNSIDLGLNAQNAEGTGIAVSAAGNIYTTGFFSGNGEFDGGLGLHNLTSSSGYYGYDTNAYVSEINANWKYVYAEDLGAGAQTQAAGIAVDGAGNVYTTGTFVGTGNFSGGAATDDLTSSTAGADTNAFVSKLNTNGQFVFAVDLGYGSSGVAAHGIAVDGSGNIYTTGSFTGTGNFAGASGTDNLTTSEGGADTNAYFSKLTTSGQYVYAIDLGSGASNAVGYGVAVDPLGNVYTTGSFAGTGDFSGVSGTHDLSSSTAGADTNTYVLKLTSAGKFVLNYALGGSSPNAPGYSIAVDGLGDIDVAGGFLGVGNFSGGSASDSLTSSGYGANESAFLSQQQQLLLGPTTLPSGLQGQAYSQTLTSANGTSPYNYSILSALPPGLELNVATGVISGTLTTAGIFTFTIGVTDLNGLTGYRTFTLEVDPGFAVGATGSNSTDTSLGNAVAADSSGNSYVTGYFTGTQNFGGVTLTGQGLQDAFVAKYSPTGKLLWVDDLGGGGASATGTSIAVDANGNVYITGYFSGTVSLLGISGSSLSSSGGVANAFVYKLNSSGKIDFAADLGAGGFAEGTGIAVDSLGNIYTTGIFTGTANFSGGSGTDDLSRPGTGYDVYVSKLNASGQYVFADALGVGDVTTSTAGIALDSSGNVYTTGSFDGTGNFNGGTGANSLNSTGGGENAFVSKLTTSGTFVFAVDLGAGSANTQASAIAIDGSGNVYTTGTFSGTGNFDGGSGSDLRTSSTSGSDTNAYVSKLTTTGQFGYAIDLGAGSPNVQAGGIVVDGLGNVYTNGSFSGAGNFAGGSGTDNLTSSGGANTYIAKLNPSGQSTLAIDLGAGSNNSASGIALDGSWNIYTTGSFTGAGNFAGGVGTQELTSSKGGTKSSFFLAQLKQSTSYQVANFPNQGLYEYNPNVGWTQLTSSSPTTFQVDGLGDVVASFTGVGPTANSSSGVYKYTVTTGWTQLYATAASALVLDSSGNIIADFTGSGLYRFTTTWTQVTKSDPTSFSVDANGDIFAGIQGVGLWEYTNGIGWDRLSVNDPTSFVVNGLGAVVGDFHGMGLYEHTSAGWIKLTPTDTSSFQIDSAGDVIGDFTGHGLYEYVMGAGWTKLTPSDPTSFAVDSAGDVIGSFGNSGLYKYTASAGWKQVTVHAPTSITVDGQGDLDAYFSGFGLFFYPVGGSQQELTTWDPTTIEILG